MNDELNSDQSGSTGQAKRVQNSCTRCQGGSGTCFGKSDDSSHGTCCKDVTAQEHYTKTKPPKISWI